MEIQIVKKILAANENAAALNRARFAKNKTLVVNLMSSPGSGKTTLLDKTLERLAGKDRAAVFEGDIRTTLDAERLQRHNVPLVQINTETLGGDCHLEAPMIAAAADKINLAETGIIFIENVGNLVCPAEFELGEDIKVALLSVTEGEDKPLKYPLMFTVCGVVLLTKTDLLEVLDFDAEKAEANIRSVNPDAQIIRISSKTGSGLDQWIEMLQSAAAQKRNS
jgi:hydrogenase nickel incorporation protein HypB